MAFSAGEKLILTMLCDISKKLNAAHEVDPDFVQHALFNSHEWALGWQYEGLFENSDLDEPVELAETADIMDMWELIEILFSNFSEEEQERITAEAKPFKPQFRGFDGNNEINHLSIAKMLVDHLDRFNRFKGRDLNCHCHSIEAHKRMLSVYNDLRDKHGGEIDLTPDEVVKILKAQIHPDYSK